MRSKAEVEVETAASILRSMNHSIEELERLWPQSKRGSNAQRMLTEIKDKRATALQCLLDAQAATPEPPNEH